MGVIGCGERGKYLTYVCQILPGVRVAAICDVNRLRLAKVHEQLGWQRQAVHDYRDILGDKSIDAVIVATNTHWHALIAIDACAAGKDVYLEKPVATSIAEGRAVIKAAHAGTTVLSRWAHNSTAWNTTARPWRLFDPAGWATSRTCTFGTSRTSGRASARRRTGRLRRNWTGISGSDPSPHVPYNPNRYAYHYWFFDYDGAWPARLGGPPFRHRPLGHGRRGRRPPPRAWAGHFAFRDNREWPDTFNGACEYPPGPVAKNGFLASYTMRHGCDQLDRRPGPRQGFSRHRGRADSRPQRL